MNIFDGIYSPNEGDIFIEGKHVNIRSAFDAMKLGIGMIHQHFMLVDTLTVLENVILGLQKQGFLIDKAEFIVIVLATVIVRAKHIGVPKELGIPFSREEKS